LRARNANTTAQTASAAPASWNTAGQPSAMASTGPPKTAIDWPIVPSPSMPSAVPCVPGADHRETKAAPIAKDDPARPRRTAATSSAP
jgi:hypothetical protein